MSLDLKELESVCAALTPAGPAPVAHQLASSFSILSLADIPSKETEIQ